MKTIRKTLRKLGWPIDQMTFKQIGMELYRRWFKNPGNHIKEQESVGIASTAGILVAMAYEGEFNNLLWSKEERVPEENPVSPEDRKLFLQPAPHEPYPYPYPDRRNFPRIPGKDIVRWKTQQDEDALGWLIDYSANGVAFVIESDRSPQVGTTILTSILSRSKGRVDLGLAKVVRIEPLNSELSLTCLQLEGEKLSPL